MTAITNNKLPLNELPRTPEETKFEELKEGLERAYQAAGIYKNQIALVKQERSLMIQQFIKKHKPSVKKPNQFDKEVKKIFSEHFEKNKVEELCKRINEAPSEELLLEKDTDKELMENCGVSWVQTTELTTNPHPQLKQAKLLSGSTVRPHPGSQSYCINILCNAEGLPLAEYNFERGSGFSELSPSEALKIEELWKFSNVKKEDLLELVERIHKCFNRIDFFNKEFSHKIAPHSNKLCLFAEQNPTFKDKVDRLLNILK